MSSRFVKSLKVGACCICTALAALSSRSVRADEVITFEGFPAGTVISEVFSEGGAGPIAVLGTRSNRVGNHAIIFDSSHPTGGDIDLGTPNQDFGGPGVGVAGESGSPFQNDAALGNLLIMANDLNDANSDGLIDNPNDYNGPGLLRLDFTAIGPIEVTSLNTLVDIEVGQLPTIEFFDMDGASLGAYALPQTGNNGVAHVPFEPAITGVGSVVVNLNGSGAIDNLAFRGTGPDCDSNGIPDDRETDTDGDGAIDACDGCPANADRLEPGLCGCDAPETDCNSNQVCDAEETDTDSDGVIDACDGCPENPNRTEPGVCGCDSDETDCNSNGICDDVEMRECDDSDDGHHGGDREGCGRRGHRRGFHRCGNRWWFPPSWHGHGWHCHHHGDPDPQTVCDCNTNGVLDECEADTDSDGVIDECDECPEDPRTTEAGICGCGEREVDCNRNRICDRDDITSGRSRDCNNNGVPDECECLRDSDRDGTPDVCDGCPRDCNKTEPGLCGCGQRDKDCNQNGVCDEDDIRCRRSRDCDRNGVPDECQSDRDGDGTIDACDRHPGDRHRC